MKNCACILCESKNLSLFSSFEGFNQLTSDCKLLDKKSVLMICSDCGHVQKMVDKNYLSSLASIYSIYHAYELADGEEQLVHDSSNGNFISRSELIVKKVLGKYIFLDSKVMDVGCGNGGTLMQLSKYSEPLNLSLYGHEIDDSKESLLKKIDGFVDLFTCSVEDINQQFDFIFMIHSLEHFVDPIRTLKSLYTKLSDDGYILFQVPNLEKNPLDILIFDHTSHFYPYTLTSIMARCGFQVVDLDQILIGKEMTLVAKKMTTSDASINHFNQLSPAYIEENINFLQYELGKIKDFLAYKSPKNFGIFGTSIASTWISSYLSDHINFYVDEDPNRVGKFFMNKPVFHPDQIADSSVVYFFLAPEMSIKIAEKFADKTWQKILTGII